MPSPHSAAYLTAMRSARRDVVVLVKVVFPGGVTTAYLSSAPITTPDGRVWEPALVGHDPIRHPGHAGSTGPDLCDAGFTLASKKFISALQKTVEASLAAFQWRGATVTTYLWERSVAVFPDGQVFAGVVTDVDAGIDKTTVLCVQREDWKQAIPTTMVSRPAYPRAPSATVGLARPIVYGSIYNPVRRDPWGGSPPGDLEQLFGGRVAVPGVMVDSGRGGASQAARFLFSGHACNSGIQAGWKLNGDRLDIILPPSALNLSSGAGFDITDDFQLYWTGVFPNDPVTGIVNPCDSPRYVGLPWEESLYASFDWDGLKRTMDWRLPSIQPPGRALVAHWVIGYQSSAALTNFSISLVKGGGSPLITYTFAPSTTQLDVNTSDGAITWGTAPWPNNPWDFSECVMRAGWTGGTNTGQTVKLYYAGLVVRYGNDPLPVVPQRVRLLGAWVTLDPSQGNPPSFQGRTEWRRAHRYPKFPDELAPDTRVGATMDGLNDDGLASHTGVAFSLIKRPPDVLHHLVSFYGLGGSAAAMLKLESGVGVPGSFVDARALMKTWRQTDMESSLFVAGEDDTENVARWVCDAGFMWHHISPFDDKHKVYPWVPGSTGVDYDRKVYKDDLSDISYFDAPPQIGGVRLPFRYDGLTRRYTSEVSVKPNASSAGEAFFGIRDEYLTVTAGVNDLLEIKVGTIVQHTFSPGVYTDISLVSGMQAINNEYNIVNVALGGRIVAGKNDQFNFSDGTIRTLTLTPGLYSMEGLATLLQNALNASGSSGWTVTYSRATKKFTIAKASGTATLFSSLPLTGACAVFGFFVTGRSGSLSYTGDVQCEERRVVITASSNHTFVFASGPNGTNSVNPRSCAELLGFDGRVDSEAAFGHIAPCPKGTRESALSTAFRVQTIEGRALYDPDTVVETRNRVVDQMGVSRGGCRITTRGGFPDMERGRRLTFDASVDALTRYGKFGSDGSWAGKKMVVVEVSQVAEAPTYAQEIVAVEA